MRRDPPEPLHYATPQERPSFWRRRWNPLDKIVVTIAILVAVFVGGYVLWTVGAMCAMVIDGVRAGR